MPVTVPQEIIMTDNVPRPSQSGRMHVLIVDEDPAVRSACCEIASSRGFIPYGIDGLDEARRLLRGNSVDILVLDLKSPAGSGLELLEEVKLLHPEIAVIVITAFATVTSAVEAMRTGANDYLTKPFALEDLAAVLDRAAAGETTGSGR